MKDEHDNSTIDFDTLAALGLTAGSVADGRRDEHGTKPRQPPLRSVNEFNFGGTVVDKKTQFADKPKGAMPALVNYRFYASYFVPVSFAAKDWNVTPRRIRFLLSAGRLAGQLKANGYWEVLYPYQFAFGTRGPSLKRQQRPPAKPKKTGTEAGTVRNLTLHEGRKS